MKRILQTIMITLALLVVSAAPALAQTADKAGPVLDVEIDPIAYALGGYSVHAGVGWERVRLDIGAFAMEMPEWMHGNEGFDASFHGVGLKLQTFLVEAQTGPFVGVGTGWIQPLVELQGTELASRHDQFSVGVQAGWRIDLFGGFFVTPWIGLDYSFNAEDVTLGGQTFENNPWTVFPTIHLGYRAR